MAFFNRLLKGKQDVTEKEQQGKPVLLSNVCGQRCKSSGVQQKASQKTEIHMQSDSMEVSSLFSGMTINVVSKQTEKQKVDEVNRPSTQTAGVSTNVQELQDLLGGQVFSSQPVLSPHVPSDGLTLDSAKENTEKVTLDKDVESAKVTNQEMQSAAVSLRKSGPSKKKKKTHSRPGYANVSTATTTAGPNNKETNENTQPKHDDFQCTENKDELLYTTEVDVNKDRKVTVSSPTLDSDIDQGKDEEAFSNKTQITDVTLGNQDQKQIVPLYTIGTPSSSEESLNGKETEIVYTNSSEDERVAHSASGSQYGVDYLCQEADSDRSGAQKELELTQVDILPDVHLGTKKRDLEKCLAHRITIERQLENSENEEVGSTLKDQVDNIFIQDTGARNLNFDKSYNNEIEPEHQLTTDTDKELDLPLRTQEESIWIQETEDVPKRDVEKVNNAILIQKTKDTIHVDDSRTCYCNVTSDGDDQLVMVERQLQEQLENISDQELYNHLEQAVLAQFSSYSEKQFKKEELLKSLQEDESQALINDNYDLAEDLSEKIDKVKMELEEMRTLLPGEDREVQQLLQLDYNMKQKKIGMYEEAQTALLKLKERESSSLTTEQQEKQLRISKEKTWISSESLRIERDSGHLKLDKEHLEKGQSQLEGEISDKTRDFNARRDDLLQQRQEVQVEIVSLERQLQELRVREAQYTSAIAKENDKIAEVKQAYAPQRNLLKQQKIKIEETEEALETDKYNLQAAQDELQKRVVDLHQTEERLARLLERIDTVLESCNETINAFKRDCNDVEEYRFGRQLAVMSSNQELSRLRQAVSESDSRVKSLSSQLQQTERALLVLRKRLNEIEAQIAELHEAKEKSKAERNFKEAKRLKEEGEFLTAEGVESQKKLESLQQQLARDSHSLQEAQIENTKLEEELRQKEYKADINTIRLANEVLARLGKFAERFREKKILKILLDAEVTICQNLIEELCEKHGISNDPACGGDVEKGSDETEETCERCETEKENSPDVTCKLFQEMSDHLDDLERQLESVIEIEDYDEADRINQEIIKLKAERDKYKL